MKLFISEIGRFFNESYIEESIKIVEDREGVILSNWKPSGNLKYNPKKVIKIDNTALNGYTGLNFKANGKTRLNYQLQGNLTEDHVIKFLKNIYEITNEQDFIQKNIKLKSTFKKKIETLDLKIFGKIDGVIFDKKKRLLEIKTRCLKSTQNHIITPIEDIIQIQLYMLITGYNTAFLIEECGGILNKTKIIFDPIFIKILFDELSFLFFSK